MKNCAWCGKHSDGICAECDKNRDWLLQCVRHSRHIYEYVSDHEAVEGKKRAEREKRRNQKPAWYPESGEGLVEQARSYADRIAGIERSIARLSAVVARLARDNYGTK